MSNSWIIWLILSCFILAVLLLQVLLQEVCQQTFDKLCVGKEYMGNPLFENLF